MPKRIQHSALNRHQEELEFSRIYCEWRDKLCYFAFLQLKNRDLAKDVVHDCFISLWQREGFISNITSVKSFLYRSVYNACINKIKSIKNTCSIDYSISLGEMGESIDSIIIRSELYGQLYRAIEKIPDRFSWVIELYYFEQLKLKEIAAKLGTPVHTVKSRRQRAIEYLRKHMHIAEPSHY